MGYYIQLNVITLIMCVVIQIKESADQQEIFNSKSFRHILLIIELIVVLDTMSLLIQNDVIPHNYWFHLMIMNGYFVLQALFPMELFRYCAGINTPNVPVFKTKLYLPFMCNVICVIANSFHPFAYHIIDGDKYERMNFNGFIFIIAWPIIYTAAGVYIISVNYKNSTRDKKDIYLHIIVFGVVALIGGVISAAVKGFLLWPFIGLDLIYLYMNVLSKTNEKLDILAFKDSLTGIGNVASYNSYSNHIQEQIDNGSAEFAIVVMDANGLKFINDNYGHEAGNFFIKKCAMYICEIFRHSPVYRIGGDEFAAILEKSDYRNRNSLLEQFDEKLKDNFFEFDGKPIRISIARGICIYRSGMKLEDVFHEADACMYSNKEKVKKELNIPCR